MKASYAWKRTLVFLSGFWASALPAQQVTLLGETLFEIKDYDAEARAVVGHSHGVSACCEPYQYGSHSVIPVAYGAVPFQCHWWAQYGCGSFTCISTDSESVAGYRSYNEDFREQCPVVGTLAFRCTPQGLQVLTTEGNPVPTDISADGSVVVGYRTDNGLIFRWTESGGLLYLPVQNACAANSCRKVFLSEDGQVVLGTTHAGNLCVAFRWSETTGFEYIGLVGSQGDGKVGVYAVSADGDTAVGLAHVGQEYRPFYWTLSGGMRFLNIPAVSVTVSADGSTVAGAYRSGNQIRAFRWTLQGGFQDIGIEVDPDYPQIYLSGTGSTLAINGRNALYYWRQGSGVANLYEHLCLYADASSLRAVGLSRDGRFILATGLLRWLNQNGVFRIDMSQPPSPRGFPTGDVNYDGIVDDADLLGVLFNFGTEWQMEPLLDWFFYDVIGKEWWIDHMSEDNESIAYHQHIWTDTAHSYFLVEKYFLNPHTSEWFCILSREHMCGRYCWNWVLASSWGGAALARGYTYQPLTFEVVTATNRFPMVEDECQLSFYPYDPCRVVSALSDDGSAAVGWLTLGDGSYEASFRWTATRGLEPFPTLGGTETYPYDVSSDGSVVVGGSHTESGALRAFLWRESAGMQSLGTLGGNASCALRVSDDGRVVYGWAETSTSAKRLFRWTAERGMQNIGLPWQNVQIRFMTPDGSVIAGTLDISDLRWIFRWSETLGLQILGAAGGDRAELTAMSIDGLTLAGATRRSDGSYQAFLWTPATGFTELGECREPSWDTPERSRRNTRVVHLSRDGTVVVWEAPDGRILYRRAGLVVDIRRHLWIRGIQADNIHGVSTDGTRLILAGTRFTPNGDERYSLMRITAPLGDLNLDGVVDDADLLIVLFNFGSSCQ